GRRTWRHVPVVRLGKGFPSYNSNERDKRRHTNSEGRGRQRGDVMPPDLNLCVFVPWQSGFRARFVLAEMLVPDPSDLGDAIISRSDTGTIERLAVKGKMKTQWQRAIQAVADGKTSPREVHRVLGGSTACRGEAGSFFRNSEG
ncbi:MAG: hypothetical protein R6U98_07370, partial [Pirellulaceae bacterium]